jgi:E3 ubiquitin-protein ligase SIAH1
MSHLLSQHSAITTLQGEDIVFMATDVTLVGNVDWVMLQSCFDLHFLLVLEKQDKPDIGQTFYAVVQFIGTNKQAENFVYRLELRKGRRRLAWEGCPYSIQNGIQSVINTSDCLIFNSCTAAMFTDNGNLAINVTLSLR